MLWSKNESVHPARMGTSKSSYWSDLTREHGYEPLTIEGEIPASLQGTLYREGDVYLASMQLTPVRAAPPVVSRQVSTLHLFL